MEGILLRDKVTVSQAVLMAAFVGPSVAVESAFAVALRLPGHRALPGALVLLMLARVFAPMMFMGFAVVTSSFLVLAGFGSPLHIAVWTVSAALLIFVYREEISRSVVSFLLMGLAFGLVTWLSKSFGFHETPEFVRCAGHCAFGAAGGLAAWAATRATEFAARK